MELLWCWRCRMEIPMLNEEEFAQAAKLYGDGMRNIRVQDKQERFHPMLDYYYNYRL